MLIDRRTGRASHHVFSELPDIAGGENVFVINETRVIPSRLLGKTGKGADIEILATQIDNKGKTRGLVKGLRKLRPGDVITFPNSLHATFIERENDFGIFSLNLSGKPLESWLNENGHIPIPPYIGRDDEPDDRERYQTVFAEKPGSCAAPTAGLHFTDSILKKLEERGNIIRRICLHVGPGTFRPVSADDISKHKMDPEYAEVPQELYDELVESKKSGKRIIAVGSTATRAIEAASLKGGGFFGETDLYIRPGFKFGLVDGLLTNFHLPGSSLLILVSAFAGRENIMNAYREAVKLEYRFYSYGDAMLIL